VPYYSDLVKRYPELSPQERVCVSNWLQHARYADFVRLLADPDVQAGLDRALADQRHTSRQPEVAILAFGFLALMAGTAAVYSLLP
jgi:hypothetical protein